MADENEAFVHDYLLPDANTRRFHVGDACQWSPPTPPNGVMPEVAAMIQAHRETIHAPGSRARGRFGLDEDGEPIETSYLGVGIDPETGALLPLDNEGNVREDSQSAKSSKSASEQAQARRDKALQAELEPRRSEKPAEKPTAR